ncbi:AIM24 family protein, partial [Streptomyces nigrescens]
GQVSQIGPGYLRIVAGGEEVARYSFTGSEFSTERAVMLGDFYLKDVWRFAAVGQGFDGGLEALLKNFGGEVAEEAEAQPEPPATAQGVPGFAPPPGPAAPAPSFGVPAAAPAPQPAPEFGPPQGAPQEAPPAPPQPPQPTAPQVHNAPTLAAPMAPPAGPVPPPGVPGQQPPAPYGRPAPGQEPYGPPQPAPGGYPGQQAPQAPPYGQPAPPPGGYGAPQSQPAPYGQPGQQPPGAPYGGGQAPAVPQGGGPGLGVVLDKYKESPTGQRWTPQNSRLIRVDLGIDGQPVLARQGSMVLYQGKVDFGYKGAGFRGRIVGNATGQEMQLMRCSGQGQVFFAENSAHVHPIELQGDAICVSAEAVLAFDESLQHEVRRIEGHGIPGGALFTMQFQGTGTVVVKTQGTPVVLPVTPTTFADANAIVAWSAASQVIISSQVSLRRHAYPGHSGETVNLQFRGAPGNFIVVQPYEV